MLCCDKLRQNTVLWTLRDWRFKGEGLFFISLLVYVANFKGCGKPLQGKHHKQKHIMWCSSFPFPLLRKNDNCMDVATVIPFTLLIFLLRLIKSGVRIHTDMKKHGCQINIVPPIALMESPGANPSNAILAGLSNWFIS